MLLAPFLWIFCEFDEKVLDNLSLAVGAYGQLLHLYYGPRLGGDMRYLLTYYDRGFSGNPYEADCDKTYSMDALPQEYPCFGNGDFRSPAFILKNSDGSYCADLRFVSCEICEGKYRIPGLPAAYDETGTESETLKVYLEDKPSGVQVTLCDSFSWQTRDGADLRAHAGGAWQSGIWKQARVIQPSAESVCDAGGKTDRGRCRCVHAISLCSTIPEKKWWTVFLHRLRKCSMFMIFWNGCMNVTRIF